MRKVEKQSQPCKSLPKIFLSMQKDQNYNKIMTATVKRLDGEGYNGNAAENMGIEVLQTLKQEYDIVDKYGASIAEEAALQSMSPAEISFRLLGFIYLTFLRPLNIYT
jgi:hypothetical protein